jgi:hypothetical protein
VSINTQARAATSVAAKGTGELMSKQRKSDEELNHAADLMAALDRAAELLATLPIFQWGGWVMYLCKALDNYAHTRDQGDACESVLKEVRRDIDTRLDTGEW